MKCNYRNCKEELKGRKDKLFCNRDCKDMEKTYRKRELKPKLKTGPKSKWIYIAKINKEEIQKFNEIKLREETRI